MKFVFIDKDEQDRDIVTDILDSYCVPYKISRNEGKRVFGYSTRPDLFDISINVKPEFYDFIRKEIQAKLNRIAILENSYSLPCADKKKTKSKEDTIKKQRKSHKPPFFDMLPKEIQDQIGDGEIVSIEGDEDGVSITVANKVPNPLEKMFDSMKQVMLDKLDNDPKVKKYKFKDMSDEEKDKVRRQNPEYTLKDLGAKNTIIYKFPSGDYLVKLGDD